MIITFLEYLFPHLAGEIKLFGGIRSSATPIFNCCLQPTMPTICEIKNQVYGTDIEQKIWRISETGSPLPPPHIIYDFSLHAVCFTLEILIAWDTDLMHAVSSGRACTSSTLARYMRTQFDYQEVLIFVPEVAARGDDRPSKRG